MGAYGISAQNIDFWLFPEVKEISSIIERLSPSVCSGNENNWIGLFVLKTSKNFETNSIVIFREKVAVQKRIKNTSQL